MKKTASLFLTFGLALLISSVFFFSSFAAKLDAVDSLKALGESTACTLSWNVVEGADGYRVYKANGDGYEILGNVKKNSFRAENLRANKNYKFTVRAYTV